MPIDPRGGTWRYARGAVHYYEQRREDILTKIEAGKTLSNLEKFELRESMMVKDDIDLEKVVLLMAALKLSQTPQGLKVLRDVAVETIRALGDSMKSLAKASVANPVTAWANPYLLSIVYERFGIVPSERMAEFRVGLSVISGAEIAEDVAGAVASMFRIFGNAPPSDFPSEVHLGDETYVYEPPSEFKFKRDKPKTKEKK